MKLYELCLKNFRTEEERKTSLTEMLRLAKVSDTVFPIDWLKTTSFFKDPASKAYHNSYAGGLFDHCVGVASALVAMTENQICYPWQRPESPIIVGLLHDTTKIGSYKLEQDMNPNTGELEAFYVTNPDYKNTGGHGADSVQKLKLVMNLTEEEELCIRYHMGAYETTDWKGFDAAIKKYPNVLFTHTADMYSSKVMERWIK